MSINPDESSKCWGLLRRRQCLALTWRGWLALLVVCAGLLMAAVCEIYPFLAVTKPVSGGFLVVEGWASDDGLRAAIAEFERNHYEKLYVTGGPLEEGAPLSEYKTFAELGAATLLKFGVDSNALQAVPAPKVRQDRTYTAAVSLRNWLRAHDLSPTKIQLLSGGPHARRSRLLYEKAFGKQVTVGVIALEPTTYDPKHWWRSSEGFRTVTGEALAYVYARFVFSVPKD